MQSGSLSEYFGQSRVNDNALAEKRDEILLRICEQGACFTTELARDCDVDMNGVGQVLYNLKRNGFITKIFADRQNPPPQIRGRLPGLWNNGINGDRITQLSWWTLTMPGVELIQTKFKGQHKKIRSSLLMAYGIPFPEPEESVLEEIINENEFNSIINNQVNGYGILQADGGGPVSDSSLG